VTYPYVRLLWAFRGRRAPASPSFPSRGSATFFRRRVTRGGREHIIGGAGRRRAS
jgi:hypothetical protein